MIASYRFKVGAKTTSSPQCERFGWSGHVVPRAQVTTKTIQKASQSYALTDLSEDDHQEYYSGFANSVLWPILHYRIDLAEFTRRDLSGYLRVNRHFAK